MPDGDLLNGTGAPLSSAKPKLDLIILLAIPSGRQDIVVRCNGESRRVFVFGQIAGLRPEIRRANTADCDQRQQETWA